MTMHAPGNGYSAESQITTAFAPDGNRAGPMVPACDERHDRRPIDGVANVASTCLCDDRCGFAVAALAVDSTGAAATELNVFLRATFGRRCHDVQMARWVYRSVDGDSVVSV